MELDIENRIRSDFKKDANETIKLLNLFEERNSLSPRVSRSIVFLSKGSLEVLITKIKEAELDWRDVVFEAETNCFEFNKPFIEK
tara:strand:- start:4934 stop:5188 length:255 start_codon:yes stop_codon:yes gene_type:complete